MSPHFGEAPSIESDDALLDAVSTGRELGGDPAAALLADIVATVGGLSPRAPGRRGAHRRTAWGITFGMSVVLAVGGGLSAAATQQLPQPVQHLVIDLGQVIRPASATPLAAIADVTSPPFTPTAAPKWQPRPMRPDAVMPSSPPTDEHRSTWLDATRETRAPLSGSARSGGIADPLPPLRPGQGYRTPHVGPGPTPIQDPAAAVAPSAAPAPTPSPAQAPQAHPSQAAPDTASGTAMYSSFGPQQLGAQPQPSQGATPTPDPAPSPSSSPSPTHPTWGGPSAPRYVSPAPRTPDGGRTGYWH